MIINYSKAIMPSIPADDYIMEEQERTSPLHRFLSVTVTERCRKYFIWHPDNKSCCVN